jgi:hypothetical protein
LRSEKTGVTFAAESLPGRIPPGYGWRMTDRHRNGNDRPDRAAEAHRILARVEKDTGIAASSALARALSRARNHMAGADADPEDWAELWGTRIGRLLGLAVCVALSIWFFRFLTHGG